MRIWVCSVIMGLSVVISACETRPQPPETEKDQALPIAKVESNMITDQDLLERIDAIEESFPRVYSTHPQKKDLLEQMVNIELLYQKALEQGIDQRYEFKSRMADLYVQELAEQSREQITDEKIRKHYENNRKQYDQISARHILLRVRPNASSEEKEEAKKQLEEWREYLVENPDEFADYAREYSQDASARQGGELGSFTFAMMVEPFSKAAFDLKEIGEISPVIETRFGYHMIQLTGDKRSFEHYKDQITDEILRDTQEKRLNQEIKRLRSNASIEIYEDHLLGLSPLPEEITTDPDELLPKEPEENEVEEP